MATPYVSDEDNVAMLMFETSSTPDFTLAATSCATFVLILIISCCLSTMTKRRRNQRMARMSDKEKETEAKEKEARRKRAKAINARSVSMFRSKESIPRFVRYGIVRAYCSIIILITIGLFLSGHLSIGAAVAMKLDLAGDQIDVDNFFEFSMAKSTYDTWVAGARELAVLIALFSGVWPYTKQLTILFLWMSSPSCVSMERRGSIFQWLDTLGKWSMIDIFVLVMSLVAFQIDVSSPVYDYLPEGFYGLKLTVVRGVLRFHSLSIQPLLNIRTPTPKHRYHFGVCTQIC